MSKFASLTAGLLARKGEAEPAATPFAEQLLTRVGTPASAADVRALTPMPHHEASAKPPLAKPLDTTPIFGSFGRRSPQELERVRGLPDATKASNVTMLHQEEDEHESQCAACPGPHLDDAGKTYHVNLRLKRLRFVRLKLSAALLRRPVQDVVGEALDAWFDRLPADVMGDCACLKTRTE